MQDLAELSDLVNPVSYRAQADVFNIGFADHFAKKVLSRLGIQTEGHGKKRHNAYAMENHVRVSQRIDKVMQHFFSINPSALGVEINSGLSTRFHRLSEQSDWPRFSWCSINSIEVNECLCSVFPTIDNHHYASCESPATQWHKHIPWQESMPTIILTGEHSPYRSEERVKGFLETASRYMPDSSTGVDVLLCHNIVGEFDALIKACDGVSIVSTQSFTPKKARFFAPSMARVRRKNMMEKVTIVHLKLVKN